MGNIQRKAAVALVAAFTLLVTGRASAQDDQPMAADRSEPTIVLHVVNYAALSREVLDEARDRVTGIYEVSGVRIVWVESEQPVKTLQEGGRHLTVMLLPADMTRKLIASRNTPRDVLGTAHLPSGRAHIFCDRIATWPGTSGFFAIRLGDVIAHEVGHLVLTTKGHSTSGIMRANLVRDILPQSFDSRQVRTIRAALVGPSGQR